MLVCKDLVKLVQLFILVLNVCHLKLFSFIHSVVSLNLSLVGLAELVILQERGCEGI